MEQRRFKLSYQIDGAPGIANRLARYLAERGLSVSVIYSHDRYLDILPEGVSKASAVDYLRCEYGLSVDDVIVAGDSGHELDMLRRSRCSIIVGNGQAELFEQPGLAHAYRARAGHGRGVVEGMRHFLEQPRSAPCRSASSRWYAGAIGIW